MPSKHIKTIINLLLYILVIFLVYFLTPKLISFFAPFVIGWIIALIANPMVKFFEKKLKIVRKHSSWLVIVGTLALVIAGCYFVLMWIIQEGIAFIKSIPDLYATIITGFYTIGDNLTSLFAFLPFDLTTETSDFFANITSHLGSVIGQIGMPTLSIAGSIAGNIPHLLVMTIFVFLSAYFFVADNEKITGGIKKILPASFMDKWTWLKNMFSKAVGGYFIAQFKIMAVIAVILWIGLMLLDVNYAILWAIVIALLDFLPFFGTGFVIWPWAVFELLTGNYAMVAGLLAVYLVCLLVHQLLQPKFVGNTVGMDSLTTLICMFIGYRISSVFGMILAVPIGIIIINLHKEGAFNQIITDLKSLVEDFNIYRKSR